MIIKSKDYIWIIGAVICLLTEAVSIGRMIYNEEFSIVPLIALAGVFFFTRIVSKLL